MGKTFCATNDRAILAASFGTSFTDSGEKNIGAIEKALAGAFPGLEVRRAFTSSMVIDILKKRDGIMIDGVEEALERALADGIKILYVQPTHLMKGIEYNGLADKLKKYAVKFDRIILSEPLLSSYDDITSVAQSIALRTSAYDDGKTAVCFMGHGTEAEANKVYTDLKHRLDRDGYKNMYIGTVEASPTLDDLLRDVRNGGEYKRAVLVPLMVVAGDHANNDMAGDKPGSWKRAFEKEGLETVCLMEGLGQIEAIRNIYISHLKTAVENDEPFGTDKAAEKIKKSVVPEDGSYLIDVSASSPMFRIKKAVLNVRNGKMTADITLGGRGYSHLFMGTEEEAEMSGGEGAIPFRADENSGYTYTVPVRALDEPLYCSAFSAKKKRWYGRQIKFLSDSLIRIR